MCTAVSFLKNDHYFGRNLDLDYHYAEAVTIIPRKYPLLFREEIALTNHYALIGMATEVDHVSLFYDATNECGLSIAALHFPGNAVYHPKAAGKYNLAPFELIPWLLAQCDCVATACNLLQKTNLLNEAFSAQLPLTPLHFLLSDRDRSVVIESTLEGLMVYDNPVGVLTNNPPFPWQIQNLAAYSHVTSAMGQNRFSDQLSLPAYSFGMGSIGLPGDYTSPSRFVRAAFVKCNSLCDEDESACVSQFFHILDSAQQPSGCVRTEKGWEKTIYSSCCNTTKGIYYYKCYDNSQITGVELFREQLDGCTCVSYPLRAKQMIKMENSPND